MSTRKTLSELLDGDYPEIRAKVRMWLSMPGNEPADDLPTEEHRAKVFSTKTPQSVQTFLVDGCVAGTWTSEKGHIRLDPFGPLDKLTRRQLDEDGERLAALHA